MSGYCSDCGKPLATGAGFCTGCGASVSQRQQGFAAAQGQASGYSPPPPPLRPQPSSGQGYGSTTTYGRRPEREISGLGWMIEPFRRYADFDGRSRRMEYWMFTLLQVIVYSILIVMIVAGMPWGEFERNPDAEPTPMAIAGILLLVLWWLITFLPSLAVKVRRLHDSDKSGWLVLLFIVVTFLLSIIGWILELVFMVMDGTRGPNQYGDDPKGIGSGDVFR